MPEQDMIHCFEHCMAGVRGWSCSLEIKKHQRQHFVGCYFGIDDFRHELTPQEIEKLPEFESDIPKESISDKIKRFIKYLI